jgi:hypothetical protein
VKQSDQNTGGVERSLVLDEAHDPRRPKLLHMVRCGGTFRHGAPWTRGGTTGAVRVTAGWCQAGPRPNSLDSTWNALF